MKSSVFLSDPLTAHETTRIPLTRPPDALHSIAREGRGEGIRFMGSEHLQNPDVSWDHEPTPCPSEGGELDPSFFGQVPSREGSGVGRFMGRLHLLVLAASSVLVLSTARAANFSDVQFWVGTGANQAAFVVDWNDGQSAESLIWGYRWDGSATGMDMFRAIADADSRLFAHISTPGAFGVSVYGIGYDLDGDNVFGVSPSLTFDGGGLAVENSPDDSRVATDTGDHWLEGWNSGFWGYSLRSSSSSVWESASTGPSDRQLSDGVWDGYSFAPGFAFTDPSEPSVAPVPEPRSLVLVVSGGLFLLCARRKLW
jgi:hypothetical protein